MDITIQELMLIDYMKNYGISKDAILVIVLSLDNENARMEMLDYFYHNEFLTEEQILEKLGDILQR